MLKWIHDFNARGLSALLYVPSGGVPAQHQQIAPLLQEAIKQACHSAALPEKNTEVVDESAAQPPQDPIPYLVPACRWTLRSLAHWLHMSTGKLFCRETARKVLGQLGHSWKNARKLLGKACPTRRAEFVAQLVPLLEQSSQLDSPLVLFCDEAHIHLDTDLGYGWAPVGKRLFVNSYRRSLGAKVTCFGVYALEHSEPVQIFTSSWANGETTCQMLRRLRLSYPDRPLILF